MWNRVLKVGRKATAFCSSALSKGKHLVTAAVVGLGLFMSGQVSAAVGDFVDTSTGDVVVEPNVLTAPVETGVIKAWLSIITVVVIMLVVAWVLRVVKKGK